MKKRVNYQKMTRLFMALVLMLTLSLQSVGLASGVDEDFLDKHLKSAGASQELIDDWEYSQKLHFYNSGCSTIDDTQVQEFYVDKDGTLKEVPQNVFAIGTRSTIPNSRLKVSHSFGTGWEYGVKYKLVYTKYEWITSSMMYRGTKGDKIAIAIPEGWRIKTGEYGCAEYQSGGFGWTQHGDGGGSPYDLNFYGAVWSLTATDNVRHKGWGSIKIEKTDSSADNKVISKYIQDVGNSTSWGIGWGPLNVSISGNKASNQVSWDSSFNW